MDDGIDIEEHDVLDNPVIKSIFPDLTILKREVFNDYYEHPYEPVEQNANPDDIVPKLEDTLESDNVLSSEESKEEDYNEYSKNSPCLGSKIILGSKPNRDNVSNDSVSLYKKITVSIENIKPRLDRCKRYCALCFTLFSKEEAYKIHEQSYHLHLMTPTLEINPESIKAQPKNVSVNTCNLCNSTFSTLSTLNKHKKRINSTKKNQNIKETKNVSKQTASCLQCNNVCSNMQCRIEQLYDTLGSKKTKEIKKKGGLQRVFKDVEHSIIERNEMVQTQDKHHKNVGKVTSESDSKESATFVYRCRVCSYCFINDKMLVKHMLRKHNIKDPAPPKKVLYEPKCKFCSSVFQKVLGCNAHIRNIHKKMLVSKISKYIKKPTSPPKHDDKFEKDISVTNNLINQINVEDIPAIGNTKENHVEYILKSALFRCNRCAIHFLNSQVAIDHVGHMKILMNWKCSICKRIFKKSDERNHMEQHMVTNDFTVHGISESTPSLILYNCPKCSVHFDKNKYLQHFPVCETDSFVHVKCKFCGLLIDSDLECLHISHHRRGNMKSTGFITVKTDLIQKNSLNQDSCKMNDKSADISIEDGTFFKVYHCKTCKCFVNEHTILKHKSAKCRDNVEPMVCILCGLVYPRKNTSSHARLHTKKIDLTLRDFGFYDLESKRLMNPPIPQFPQCSICEINFPRKNDKIGHCCGEEEYTVCSTCNLKFSELGYKLHMNYHDFTFSHCKLLPETAETLNTAIANAETYNNILIYTCKHCHMSLYNYDLVVEHCQEHLNSEKIKAPDGLCKICDIVFDAKFKKIHDEIHTKTFDKSKLVMISFDTCGFKSDYAAWIKHIFSSLSQEQMLNIVEKSIYKYENKIKMQLIQEGTCAVTLYKCDVCRCYVDPQALIEHLATNCRTLRNHACKVCSIPFVSLAFKAKHEEVHKLPFKGLQSYRIILFNRKEETSNSVHVRKNRFTLYKCAKCDGIVSKDKHKDHLCNRKDLKLCTHCNLLIYSEDFNLHLSKHKKLVAFTKKNIKLIVFENENDEVCPPKRKKYDYSIYKCKQCQVCIKDQRSSRKHVCNSSISKSKCSICGLYLVKCKLKTHCALHTSDSNFVIDNITLIDFDNTKTISTEIAATSMKNNNNKAETNTVQKKNVTTKLYRCPCGLHFLDLTSTWTHQNTSCRPKHKINDRQQCSKCGLAFNPSVLFKHLLKHHGNKDVTYKFDIIDAIKKR